MLKDILDYGNNQLKKWDGLHYIDFIDKPITTPCKIKVIGVGKSGSDN